MIQERRAQGYLEPDGQLGGREVRSNIKRKEVTIFPGDLLVPPQVIPGLKAWDETTVTAFYHHALRRGTGIALEVGRGVLSREDAEDVFQDRIMRLLQKVNDDDFREEKNPSGYFGTMIHRKAIDTLRKRILEKKHKFSHPSGWNDPEDDPPEELVTDNEKPFANRVPDQQEAQDAIRGVVFPVLPPLQREVLEFTAQGLTHTEIAQRLRTPMGTIKTRIRLAKRKAQEALRSHPYYGEAYAKELAVTS